MGEFILCIRPYLAPLLRYYGEPQLIVGQLQPNILAEGGE